MAYMEPQQPGEIGGEAGNEEQQHPTMEYYYPVCPSGLVPEAEGNLNYSNYNLSYNDGGGGGYWNETFLDEDFYPNGSFSSAFQVAIYILYNTVFIAAVLGNILVCYVVFSSPKMRTVTNYLIANLALGDLLMAILCVPFSYIPVLYQYWPFGKILCHVLSPAQAVCVFVSAYTLVALAGDRYMAILYPLKPRLRRSQAVVVILVVWIVAILTATPIALYTTICVDNSTGKPICQEFWKDDNLKLYYSLALMVLQYFFPLAVLIFTYTRIALAVWGKKAPGEAEDGRDQRLAKAKRKMIKMMLTVVVVYTISWLPFNALIVFADIQGAEFWAWPPIRFIFFAVHWMAMSHTVCNPIIYCWMNSRFRAGFKTAAYRVPCVRRLCLGRRQSENDYRLQRMGTCTTFTFAPSGHGRLARGGSLVSNRTILSEAGTANNNTSPLMSGLMMDNNSRGRSGSKANNNSFGPFNNNGHHSPALIRPPYANVVNPRLNNNAGGGGVGTSISSHYLTGGPGSGSSRRGSSRRESMESFM